MNDFPSIIARWLFFILGGIWGYLEPTLPFALVCLFAVFIDAISAWRLAKRVRRHHPEIPDEKIHDKFESEKAWKCFPTLLIIYSLIAICHLIDTVIFPFLDMYLANFMAGGFSLYQVWSILENESSENPRSWAKFLQKFMVNKASRHIEEFGEAINSLKDEDKTD